MGGDLADRYLVVAGEDRSQTSIAAIAKRWPGPKALVLTRSMAVKSTKTALVATLLAPVQDPERLVNVERLRIEYPFVCPEVKRWPVWPLDDC